MGTNVEKAHWRALGRETRRRLGEPLGHPTFVLSLIGMTLFIGGLGVWWEIACRFLGFHRIGGEPVTDCWNMVNATATYLITLSAVSLMDLTIRHGEEGVRAFRLVTILLGMIAILAGFLGLIAATMGLALFFTGIGVAASLIVWWVANADNDALRDDPPPTATTGGNTENQLQGSLEGIKA